MQTSLITFQRQIDVCLFIISKLGEKRVYCTIHYAKQLHVNLVHILHNKFLKTESQRQYLKVIQLQVSEPGFSSEFKSKFYLISTPMFFPLHILLFGFRLTWLLTVRLLSMP